MKKPLLFQERFPEDQHTRLHVKSLLAIRGFRTFQRTLRMNGTLTLPYRRHA